MYRNRFFKYLEFEKRYSPHTLVAYKTDLSQYFHYLKEHYELDELATVTHQLVRAWTVSLMENGFSNRSINRKITTLKTYYRFLVREGVLDSTPMNKVVAPKTSKRLPEFVDVKGMQKLFNQIEFPDGFEGARDKLILEVFYSTGIRLSELINIQQKDLDFTNSTIKVLGKRNKERIIPFGIQLKQAFEAFLKLKSDLGYSNTSLFVTSKDEKVYKKLVYRVVNRYVSAATTINKKSPHILRHTFATHMLNNGADINAIKELLGHSNLSATQVYTHNTFEKLRDIYNQAHPRA